MTRVVIRDLEKFPGLQHVSIILLYPGSHTYIGNSILIMENSDSGGCETLETPNMFLNPSILNIVTILILSCFILEIFALYIKVVLALFNLESLFFKSK